VPAAKPIYTGTLGKTSRGRVNRSYFRDTPSGSSGGLVSLPDGVLVFSSHGGLRQPEPNGWSRRGEKSVYERACEGEPERARPSRAGRDISSGVKAAHTRQVA
jgi:hypothetical protein